MKKSLILLVMVLAGCCSVPEDVASSIDVLRDNTHTLAGQYEALLDRAGPEPLPDGPEGEADGDLAERMGANEAAWRKYVAHQKALTRANSTLADRVQTWAAICAGKQEPVEGGEDP